MKRYIYFILGALACLSSCVYPFEPEGVKQESGIVVIEGDINAGTNSSFLISLSVSLDDQSEKIQSLDRASLYIEGEDGAKYDEFTLETLEDSHYLGGVKHAYVIDTEKINDKVRHRLVVDIPGAKSRHIVSSWQSCLQSPPIGDIIYEVDEEKTKVDIFVNTLGTDDSLRYYKWDYVEDWEFTSYYMAEVWYDFTNNAIRSLDGESNLFYCWNKSTSSNINILTTEQLSENVVEKHLIKTIYKSDYRISYLYAIEVHQKVLSKESYKYWETLLKNNEQTGGIFAAQPNEMRGNLTNERDPEEAVLGYVNAYSVQKKRIMISSRDLRIYRSNENCVNGAKTPELWKASYASGWEPLYIDQLSGNVVWAPARCVNCTMRGTKKKPDYWPNNDK